MKVKLHQRRKRRGAYYVELAFTIVPMMAIAMAIVDYSMPIFYRSLLTHAAREGARFGITYRTLEANQTQTAAIHDVVMSQSAGFLTGTTGRNMIKVRYYDQLTFAENTGANRNANGNIIEVSIEGFEWNHIFPMYRESVRKVVINASSADRLETLPPGAARPLP